MEIEGYFFPDDLYYSNQHVWLKIIEGNIVRIGMTDFGQSIAGEIVYIRLKPVGRNVQTDKNIGTMETGKWVGGIKSPVTGVIKRVNEQVLKNPKLVNEQPYGDGWVAEVEAEKLEEELKLLMKPSTEEFKKFIKEEKEKYK